MLCLCGTLQDDDAAAQSSRSYAKLMRQVDLGVREMERGVVGAAGRPLKPSVRKYIEKWLLQRAACPLRPAWTDLGPLFWPRWVRRGACGGAEEAESGEAASCSWPPGMRCVPGVGRTVRLLHWHCSATARRRRQRRRRNEQLTTATGSARAVLSSFHRRRRIDKHV